MVLDIPEKIDTTLSRLSLAPSTPSRSTSRSPSGQLQRRESLHESTDIVLEHTSSRAHACHICNMEWPMPRKITWPVVPTPPDPGLLKVRPDTTETIIVYQTFDRDGKPSIPDNVFKTFTFCIEDLKSNGQEGNRALAQGVRYEKNTGATAETDLMVSSASLTAKPSTAYLRIMNLNVWYWSLGNAMMNTCWKVMELESNVMLSAALLSDTDLVDAIEQSVRFTFIFSWAFLLFFSVYWAWAEARVEWIMKTNPAKGDLISNCGTTSRWQTFLAMVAFEFFNIEKDVKDVIINLHPWKGVQDYSAFKSEGHRAFFVGYRSKTMHRVENTRSVWKCLPQQVLTKVAVLVFKIFLVYKLFVFENKHKVSYTLVAATGGSLFVIASDVYLLVNVWRLRRKFKQTLLTRLASGQQSNPKQHQADIRLLALHFRRTWNDNEKRCQRFSNKEFSEGSWIRKNAPASKDEAIDISKPCKACGRTPDGLGPMSPANNKKRPKISIGGSGCASMESLDSFQGGGESGSTSRENTREKTREESDASLYGESLNQLVPPCVPSHDQKSEDAGPSGNDHTCEDKGKDKGEIRASPRAEGCRADGDPVPRPVPPSLDPEMVGVPSGKPAPLYQWNNEPAAPSPRSTVEPATSLKQPEATGQQTQATPSPEGKMHDLDERKVLDQDAGSQPAHAEQAMSSQSLQRHNVERGLTLESRENFESRNPQSRLPPLSLPEQSRAQDISGDLTSAPTISDPREDETRTQPSALPGCPSFVSKQGSDESFQVF